MSRGPTDSAQEERTFGEPYQLRLTLTRGMPLSYCIWTVGAQLGLVEHAPLELSTGRSLVVSRPWRRRPRILSLLMEHPRELILHAPA